MSVDIKGSVAFITGASSGIGRQTAIRLSNEGCHVFCVGRKEEALKETQRLCNTGVKVLYSAFDITHTDKLQEAITRCVKELGGLNILVNNAGRGALFTSSMELWEETIQVNLMALMRATKLALPFIEESKGPKCFIFICSSAGTEKFGPYAPYVASKHGVLGFSGALWNAVQEQGIKVCCILPGWVNTPMVKTVPKADFEKMLKPEDIADTIMFVLKFPVRGCPTEIHLRPQYIPV